MTFAALLRNWREVILAIAFALPVLSLVIPGLIWLWQSGYGLAWAGAMAVIALVVVPLEPAVRRRAQGPSGTGIKPSPEWGTKEKTVWIEVEARAGKTRPPTSLDQESIVAVLKDTLEFVARRFHPDTADPLTNFTVPEALLLTERVSRDLRREVLRYGFGARTTPVAYLLWAYRVNERHGPMARGAFEIGSFLWRVSRAVVNPVAAGVAEGRAFLWGQARGVLFQRLLTHVTRRLVLETGRAAIDLYSGRLTLSDEDIRAERERDMAGAAGDAPPPVRILLAGQVNAGKSSLLNAMAQEVHCATGPVPTTAGVKEFRLEAEGRPAADLVDMPGLGDADEAEFMRQFERADLVLWVASATQPARAPDKRCLDAFRGRTNAELSRRPPPLLLALTHVDRLRPSAEWAPPYDVVMPVRPKAKTMRDAMRSVAQTLDLPEDAVVPVALPPGGEPYNLDALWARMTLDLDEAKLAQLDRLRAGREGLRLGELAAQIGGAGRWVARAIVRG